MIDRVLEREFVLAQADAVLQQLQAGPPEKELAEADLDPEEARSRLDEIKSALGEAIRDESARDPLGMEDRKAYIPTNAVLSVLQTVIEERLRDQHAEALRPSPGLADPGGPAATAVFVGAEGMFVDDKWVTNIAKALARSLLRKGHRFETCDPPPSVELALDARIVLVGDWGMGNTPARAVSQRIEKELAGAGDRQTHVIHLGDVYYSGERSEAQRNILDLWPVKPGDAKRYSWALNGNHDMYSGGHGYFETILGVDDRFRHQRSPDGRGISYFRLHNKHWQFLGLDTAWEQHLLRYQGLHGFLKDPQGDWVRSCVQASQGRRTVLLTHHQFISEHHRVRGNLASKLRPVLDGPGGIDAWFWGHEHICMKFPRRPDVRYPACVGHGSIPHPAGNHWSGQDGWEYDDGYTDGDQDHWRWCGYAVLDLQGSKIAVRHVDQQGNEHHPAALPA